MATAFHKFTLGRRVIIEVAIADELWYDTHLQGDETAYHLIDVGWSTHVDNPGDIVVNFILLWLSIHIGIKGRTDKS